LSLIFEGGTSIGGELFGSITAKSFVNIRKSITEERGSGAKSSLQVQQELLLLEVLLEVENRLLMAKPSLQWQKIWLVVVD
jgi:hypothetical protein